MANWEPEGIILEPTALEVAKNKINTLVVAGPGAGKTELLAQRACFLLQTGLCPQPYRILAISFKREAAENLKNRVILRCGRELAARFDSMTYDAFAKDLLDRFRLSLPKGSCPSPDYEIITGADVSNDRLLEVLIGLSTNQCNLSERDRRSITGMALVRDGILGRALPYETWPNEIVSIAGASMWRAMVATQPSRLSFPMIGRLAEFIVQGNNNILKTIQATYKFVFLDEFQDTTTTQLALTEACFLGSPTVLTAVGDTKQKIMGWAGALPGVFKRFQQTFGAAVKELTKNHRSRSRLVDIQSVFAKELDPDSIAASASRLDGITGECRVFEFSNETKEAAFLAELVERSITFEKVPPEEICVLCRARPDSFAQTLNAALKARGIKVRVEVNRREIVSEPVSALLLNMIALIFSDSEAEAWEHVNAVMANLSGDYDDQKAVRTMARLLEFLSEQKKQFPQTTATNDEIVLALHKCLNFLGRDQFAALHPQYAQGDYLETVIERLVELIAIELPDSGWNGVVKAVKGVGAISIMTMHKSKGLEFHTVIFLGLEDNAIWNYQKDKDEETCGLFVALSRAKERCIFTYCRSRPGRYRTAVTQTRLTIKPVFDLFDLAGVKVETID